MHCELGYIWWWSTLLDFFFCNLRTERKGFFRIFVNYVLHTGKLKYDILFQWLACSFCLTVWNTCSKFNNLCEIQYTIHVFELLWQQLILCQTLNVWIFECKFVWLNSCKYCIRKTKEEIIGVFKKNGAGLIIIQQ